MNPNNPELQDFKTFIGIMTTSMISIQASLRGISSQLNTITEHLVRRDNTSTHTNRVRRDRRIRREPEDCGFGPWEARRQLENPSLSTPNAPQPTGVPLPVPTSIRLNDVPVPTRCQQQPNKTLLRTSHHNIPTLATCPARVPAPVEPPKIVPPITYNDSSTAAPTRRDIWWKDTTFPVPTALPDPVYPSSTVQLNPLPEPHPPTPVSPSPAFGQGINTNHEIDQEPTYPSTSQERNDRPTPSSPKPSTSGHGAPHRGARETEDGEIEIVITDNEGLRSEEEEDPFELMFSLPQMNFENWENRLVFVDLELTGGGIKNHPVQAAFSSPQQPEEVHSEYITPLCPIDRYVSNELHGITYDSHRKVMKARGRVVKPVKRPRIVDGILKYLKTFRQKPFLVAHSGDSCDFPQIVKMMMEEERYEEFEPLVEGYVDSLQVFKKWKNRNKGNALQDLRKEYKLVSPTENKQLHDAVDDTIDLQEIFMKDLPPKHLIQQHATTPAGMLARYRELVRMSLNPKKSNSKKRKAR